MYQNPWQSLSAEVIDFILERATPYTVVQLRRVSTYLGACAQEWLARRRAHMRAVAYPTYREAKIGLIKGILRDNVSFVDDALFVKHIPLDQPLMSRQALRTASKCVKAYAAFEGCAWTPIEHAVVMGAYRSLDFLFRVGARYPFNLEVLLGYAFKQCDTTASMVFADSDTHPLSWERYPLVEVVDVLLRHMRRAPRMNPAHSSPLTMLRRHLGGARVLESLHPGTLAVLKDTVDRIPWVALASRLIDVGGYDPHEPHPPGKASERAKLQRKMDKLAASQHSYAHIVHEVFVALMHLYDRHPSPRFLAVTFIPERPI